MKLIFAIILCFCQSTMAYPAFAQAPEKAGKTVKIVAFGTSLTARANWPERLGEALAACTGDAVTVETVAKSGETTEWGLTQIDHVVGLAPDIILIELYANDAALNRWIGVSASRQNFAAILDQLHARLPKARIVAMSMNPIFGMRGMIRPYLDSYIEAHRQEVKARGLEYVDNARNWAKLSDAELGRIIADGSHPLPDEASKIVVPELVKVISHGRCKSSEEQ